MARPTASRFAALCSRIVELALERHAARTRMRRRPAARTRRGERRAARSARPRGRGRRPRGQQPAGLPGLSPLRAGAALVMVARRGRVWGVGASPAFAFAHRRRRRGAGLTPTTAVDAALGLGSPCPTSSRSAPTGCGRSLRGAAGGHRGRGRASSLPGTLQVRHRSNGSRSSSGASATRSAWSTATGSVVRRCRAAGGRRRGRRRPADRSPTSARRSRPVGRLDVDAAGDLDVGDAPGSLAPADSARRRRRSGRDRRRRRMEMQPGRRGPGSPSFGFYTHDAPDAGRWSRAGAPPAEPARRPRGAAPAHRAGGRAAPARTRRDDGRRGPHGHRLLRTSAARVG